jgi:hypothetical protein
LTVLAERAPNRNRKTVYIDTHGSTLRERVFGLLDKNHELKPKELIILLADTDITYAKHGETVRQYRKNWKTEYKNRQALNCLNFHNCRGFIYALNSMDRAKAVGKSCRVKGSKTGVVCWRQSLAKNRMLVFIAQGLGRVEWFETGRINFWARKPATWHNAKQLLAYAFCWTGIIEDPQIFDLWFEQKTRLKGAHATIDTGERLPYCKVDMLKESNGVVVRMGDVSHPTSLEIEFVYPNWQDRNERLLESLLKQQAELQQLFYQLMSGQAIDTGRLNGGKDYVS